MGEGWRSGVLPINDVHLVAVLVRHLLQRRRRGSAIRALKIGELHERNGCALRTHRWSTGVAEAEPIRLETQRDLHVGAEPLFPVGFGLFYAVLFQEVRDLLARLVQ